MFETIFFGEQIYGYLILILILGASSIFIVLFWRWFQRLFVPSKLLLNKGNRVLFFLLISWPLLIASGGFWGAYQIGYRHFYSLRISPEQEVVIRYLWPKGEVHIPISEIIDIAVIRKGRGWKGSDVLVITTNNGKRFQSSAPVPSPQTLPVKIKTSIHAIEGS